MLYIYIYIYFMGLERRLSVYRVPFLNYILFLSKTLRKNFFPVSVSTGWNKSADGEMDAPSDLELRCSHAT